MHTQILSLAATVALTLSGSPTLVTTAAQVSGTLSCHTAAPGDSDGDGRTDPLVGVPGADGRAGRVVVMAGTATGVRGRGYFEQGRNSVPGVNAPGSRFGTAVATGDVNGDGCGDWAVTAPNDSAEPHNPDFTYHSGSVTVFYGHPGTGLSAAGAQLITAHTLGIEQPQIGHGTDSAVDTTQSVGDPVFGDFDGDGNDDLALLDVVAVSDPDYQLSRVVVVPGTPTGLDLMAARTFRAPGSDVNGRQVGSEIDLATGNLRGGRYDDLAVAVGGDTSRSGGPVHHADGHHPEVHVVFGAAAGLGRGQSGRLLDEETHGVPGSDPADGSSTEVSVILGDFNGDGRDDLAWGLPDVNRVSMVPGSAGGVAATGALTFTYGRGGMAGSPTTRPDTFGTALAAADFNGDGDDELVAGSAAGHVSVIPGTHAHGLTSSGDLLLSPNTPGVPGALGDGSEWGRVLQVGYYGHGLGADLLVSDQAWSYRVGNTLVADAGDVTELFGSKTRNAGITTKSATRIDEATHGVPGVRTAGDAFGGASS
jgi:hypothetical protein